MIDTEQIVEYITNEKKVEHQFRTIKRLERPNVKSVTMNKDEISGVYECKKLLSK